MEGIGWRGLPADAGNNQLGDNVMQHLFMRCSNFLPFRTGAGCAVITHGEKGTTWTAAVRLHDGARSPRLNAPLSMPHSYALFERLAA